MMYAGDEMFGDEITSPDVEDDYPDDYDADGDGYSEATGDYGQWD